MGKMVGCRLDSGIPNDIDSFRMGQEIPVVLYKYMTLERFIASFDDYLDGKVWYWGSSDTGIDFGSLRDHAKKAGEFLDASSSAAYFNDNGGAAERDAWRHLYRAGFLFPHDESYTDPNDDPRFCFFLRQYSHSACEGRFKVDALHPPFDCREVTTNFKVALFFACQPMKDRNKDGKVVRFRPFDGDCMGIRSLDSANLEFEYSSVYPECDYYLRAKRQSAVLLQNTRGDKGTLESMNSRILDTLVIPSIWKQRILYSLDSKGINFDYLFSPLKACRQEQIITSGSDASEQESEFAREKRRRDERYERKGDLNWLYDMPF